MKSKHLSATLVGEIRVISITSKSRFPFGLGRYTRVELEVEGERVTLAEGDTVELTLNGRYDA